MPGFDEQAQARLARALKQEAARLGFDACGIARAERLDEEARRLEQWLARGYHGTMYWMERHFDKRTDPRRLVDGARSVISVLHNYYQPVEQPQRPTAGKISRYAWGDDYHEVMKEKLYRLYAWLDEQAGGIHGRAFVDSAPVMDKAWARRSGLGWIGKHTNLINRSLGSYFFLGELIVDVPLPPDGPVPDYCGTCTRCLDACPTDAIVQPYVVDANRCISYLTIEHRGDDIPEDLRPGMGTWIFGCDVCQDVCPWNKFKRPASEPRYAPRPGLTDTELREWVELDLEEFRRRFRKSPVKRAKLEGFLRNVRIALENAADAGETPSGPAS
ncbi:tRNA epoxyqueuosine(34) reductase QueG [Rhodocaloribacter litoris]|uniref:tRNA epoxyqueuosine(34) reductase QueG n=1 Tax=Rhodocaloribacter litoris TaxID=2558931 RepID=UPI001420B0F4|nr:tRNA epoxyqueuosine(34) reductase QueG [Rhodocaloribacter litoris]QXD13996.1 tRNA epoxyqueuosine(34) reductase QueG [Rhodocaloribacter litoris]